MATKRMFSLQIVDTDAFLEMPMTSQLLYFHLAMRADDEGFVGNPKRTIKMTGASDDDFKILVAKRFLLTFKSGVVVIKHWLVHNTIRMDRFNPTAYQEEKNSLIVKENKAYTELHTNGKPNGNQLEPQVKLSKVNLSEVKLREDDANPAKEFFETIEIQERIIKDLVAGGLNEGVVRREVTKFILYWTESNGKKQRWQWEKVFDVKRRLVTWFGRVKDSNQNKIANI